MQGAPSYIIQAPAGQTYIIQQPTGSLVRQTHSAELATTSEGIGGQHQQVRIGTFYQSKLNKIAWWLKSWIRLLFTVTDVLITCLVVIFRAPHFYPRNDYHTGQQRSPVTVNNSAIQDYTHLDDHVALAYMTWLLGSNHQFLLCCITVGLFANIFVFFIPVNSFWAIHACFMIKGNEFILWVSWITHCEWNPPVLSQSKA